MEDMNNATQQVSQECLAEDQPFSPVRPRRSSTMKSVIIGLKDQIRILDLLPGNDEDEIECELRVVTLGTEEYETVSYVWGDLLRGRTIKVDGFEQSITVSLHTALRRLRNATGKRFLWVDQLCINQWDKEEKMHQVNLMREIYKQCSRCLNWLGDTDDMERELTVRDAEGALDFIRHLAASDNDEKDVPSTLATPESAEKAKMAFEHMILHPWWSRIWTVQEAILPPTSIFIWGPLSIPIEIMSRAAKNIHNNSSLESFPNSGYLDDEVANHFTSRVMGLGFTGHGEIPLYILKRWMYRAAIDPLDKVYALMGLFPHGAFPRVPSCDYELSPATLYTRIACDLIEDRWNLMPLIGQRGEPRETADLPTWVPDLVRRHEYVKRPWMFWNHIFRYFEFSAAGKNYIAEDSVTGGSELRLRGVYVDKVVEVGEVLTDENIIEPSEEQLVSTISGWRMILTKFMSKEVDKKYISGGTWTDAFWRTMLGDLIMEIEAPIRRATSSDAQQFDSFMENLTINDTLYSLQQMVLNQAFFITQTGYIGIGPPSVIAGDEVWVLFGGNVPFVLRPQGDKTQQYQERVDLNNRNYHFVGDAFVHGIMDGEAVEDCEDKQSTILLH